MHEYLEYELTNDSHQLSLDSKLTRESSSNIGNATFSIHHAIGWFPDLIPHVSRNHDQNDELYSEIIAQKNAIHVKLLHIAGCMVECDMLHAMHVFVLTYKA